MGVLVTVMGIDIKPGYSPRSSRAPRYAVVVLRDGHVIDKLDDAPLHTIIRYIVEYHVDILAVDNVSELAEDSRDMARLSRIIPSWCRVVEVTNTTGGFKSVSELAKEIGLQVKPSTPLDTALVNAYAAYRGYGKVIKLPPERVYVIVSKGRTPAQGGASSNRFKRSIRASILQLVRDVREALDKAGLDYDLVVKKSDGGLERGLFVVYAPMERVREAVSPVKSKNARILIKPVSSSKPVIRPRKAVIMGIDPGTSVGVAVIDFEGNPLIVKSYKNPDREQIINDVLVVGKPVVVAVDTARPPGYAKKVASLLGARLHTPEEDLGLEEKHKLVSEFAAERGVEIPDSHACDALAAALKAYGQIKPLIDEVESKIRGISGVNRDEIICQVLQGRPLSEVLEEAFHKVLAKGRKQPIYRQLKASEKHHGEGGSARLQSKVSELENTVKRLEKEVKLRDELIEKLELELKLLKKKPVNEDCERRLNQLRVELEVLRRSVEEKLKLVEELKSKITRLETLIIGAAMGKYTLACKHQSLDSCNGMPVYVDNEANLHKCVEYARSSRTGVLVPAGFKPYQQGELRVPVLGVNVVLDLGNYVLVEGNVLEVIKSAWREIDELESRERRERILKMVREYQEARKRELSKG